MYIGSFLKLGNESNNMHVDSVKPLVNSELNGYQALHELQLHINYYTTACTDNLNQRS